MIIKIDVDGVIRNIFTPMLKIYNMYFGTDLTYSSFTKYDVDEVFPLIKEKKKISAKKLFFESFAKTVFLEGADIFENAKQAIDDLRENGHYVIISTYQPTDESKHYTIDFLSRNKINYDSICFTKDKHLIKADVIVDDNPDFLEKEGDDVLKVCIKAPYNLYYTDKNLVHYDSLYSFTNDLLKTRQ